MAAPNEHVFERLVIRHQPYIETIEASMMQCALEVWAEPEDTHGYENRRALALAIFINPDDTERFARFFAWLAIFNPEIRGQVFHGPDDIRPEEIDGETLRTLIKNAWNVAANVQPESEQEG